MFFTSDHGDYAGHRGLLQKTPWIPFDDLARVPLLAVGNGISGGRREAALVQSSDIALTCLDYAGVKPPSGVTFDTRSLRPILDDDPSPADLERTVFSATSLHDSVSGRLIVLRHCQATPVRRLTRPTGNRTTAATVNGTPVR